ncbi:hypothetical protein Tco_0403474 [Tanacetum coccineum]
MPLFRMAGLQCRTCRGDKVRVLQIIDQRVLLLAQGKEKLVQGEDAASSGMGIEEIVLDEEQLAFLADPRVAQGPDTQTKLPINAAF